MPLNSRKSEWRDSLWHGPDQVHTPRFQCEHRGRSDHSDYNVERDRLVFKENFAKHEQSQRDSSDEKRHRVGFVQVFEEIARVLPEASMRAVETEDLRQLCAGEEKCYAAFEAGHNAL